MLVIKTNESIEFGSERCIPPQRPLVVKNRTFHMKRHPIVSNHIEARPNRSSCRDSKWMNVSAYPLLHLQTMMETIFSGMVRLIATWADITGRKFFPWQNTCFMFYSMYKADVNMIRCSPSSLPVTETPEIQPNTTHCCTWKIAAFETGLHPLIYPTDNLGDIYDFSLPSRAKAWRSERYSSPDL